MLGSRNILDYFYRHSQKSSESEEESHYSNKVKGFTQ